MNAFEKRLAQRIREDVPDLSAITPGVVIEAWEKGRKKGRVRVGETYPYYDLASLTKIIFSGTAAMHYFSAHRADLKKSVRNVLPWFRHNVTPFQLMSHSAGLEWWLPVYKKLKGPMNPVLRWAQMERQLAKLKRRRTDKAVYSDPDMWMLGAYLREAQGFELHDLWLETADRVGLKDLFFQPGNKRRYKKNLYAPTEKCPWRKTTLQGQVHDENCFALGGVSSHAGLFGTMDGVVNWGLKLRRAFYSEEWNSFGDPKMVRLFTGRRIPRANGDWGLCFMKPSRPGASCGRYFSTQSFGHTGFTGTSFWFDPRRDLMVVILSNRVHPTRENKSFLKLRPQLHDFVVECL